MELEQVTHERETTDPDPEMWRWSPLELTEFDHMLTIARQLFKGLRNLKFCEAGCGIGTKLYLAERYFDMEAVGFEISHDYLEKAAALGVDARYMDFREEHPNWSEYDIVYIGRPFKTDEAESAFEASVQEAMRHGSVLMMCWTSNKPYSWPCFYRAPFRGVWRKPAFKTGVYDAMIRRQEPYDPLVPTPVGYPG
jgi:SAM-dependent methyltransferase